MDQKIIKTDKIKKIIVFSASLVLIVLLGFAPVPAKVVLAIYWGDLGLKMTDAGAIDKKKI